MLGVIKVSYQKYRHFLMTLKNNFQITHLV